MNDDWTQGDLTGDRPLTESLDQVGGLTYRAGRRALSLAVLEKVREGDRHAVRGHVTLVDLERLCDHLAALVAVSPPDSPRALLARHVAHPEQIDTLLDLARDGEHETFTGLVACLGVAPDTLEPLWEGPRRRLGR